MIISIYFAYHLLLNIFYIADHLILFDHLFTGTMALWVISAVVGHDINLLCITFPEVGIF